MGQMLAVLNDILTFVTNGLNDVLVSSVVEPFRTSDYYRAGFLWAVFLSVITRYIYKFVLWTWKAISLIFTPSKEPATKDGKSPWEVFVGFCKVAVVWSGIVFVWLLKSGYFSTP